MYQWHVSIEVKKDRIRSRHLVPWVLQSFNVLARDSRQAIQQAKVRAVMLGLATNDVFMCTLAEGA